MKSMGLFISILLVTSSIAAASGSLFVGRIVYDDDLCSGCKSKPEAANLYGLKFHLGALPLVDLGFSLEYAKCDVDAAEDCSQGGKGELTHYRLAASGSMTFWSIVLASAYAGGGISYHWFDVGGLRCEGPAVGNGAGYHGFVGIRVYSPGLPISPYLEARIGWLTGTPGLATKSAYLGARLSL